PALRNVTYEDTTSSMRAFSRTSAMSSSRMRPATPVSLRSHGKIVFAPPDEGAGCEHGAIGADDGSMPKKGFPTLAKRTVKELVDDDGTDLAAPLPYYSVPAIFPAIAALMALLGVVRQADKSVTTILDILQPLVSAQMLGDVDPVIRQLA